MNESAPQPVEPQVPPVAPVAAEAAPTLPDQRPALEVGSQAVGAVTARTVEVPGFQPTIRLLPNSKAPTAANMGQVAYLRRLAVTELSWLVGRAADTLATRDKLTIPR